MSRLKSLCLIASLVAIFVLAGGAAQSLRAQGTLQNAILFGTVTDSSGGAISGATVEVTSPSLQGTKTATTDASGNYRVLDLPAGAYHIAYTMAGFRTDVRSDFNLTAGFNARVDVSLQVGSTTQTVEVTGLAPVVDTATTSATANIERPVMDAVPTTRSLTDAVYLTPGVRPSNTPDIGGSVLGNQQGIGAYGFAANLMTLSDGIDVMQNGGERAGPTGDGVGQLLDYDSVEQVQVITTGAEAEIGEAGPITIVTMKSGSNQFHGDAHAYYEPHGFQLTNLPAGSPGLGSASNQLQYFWDAQGDVGGRIIRDKLWFWAGYHPERSSAAVFGYIGPDGGQGYNITQQDDSEAKVTYQATKTLKFVGDYNYMTKIQPQQGGGPTRAYGSTYYYPVGFWNEKGEVIWTPNAKWLFDFLGGYKNQYYTYQTRPGHDVPGNPYTLNQTTGIITGAIFNTGSSDSGSHDRQVYYGSLSYFPNGKHSIQGGSQWFWPEKDQDQFVNHPAGNYEVILKNATAPATGVVPYQLVTYNFPFYAKGKETAVGEYAKDTWRATTRLTLNLGIRFDHYHVFNSPITAPPGPFSLGGSAPYLSVGVWNRVVPRIGAAYDLTGSGKTVIRASYGMYNIPYIGIFDLGAFNPIGTSAVTYDASKDTCAATAFTPCAPSAAFLNAITASLANPSATTFGGKNIYVGSSAPALALINPKLKMPFVHELSVQVQRELRPNLAVSAIYVYSREEDMYDQVFPNRPITSYTLPYVTTYPALDPVNGGKPLTIYTYPASLATANQFEFVTRTSNPDFYNALGFSMTKRKVNKWGAGASLDFIKSHTSLSTSGIFSSTNGFGQSSANPTAPYQTAFPLDLTWDYTFKSYLIYALPYRVTLGLNYSLLAGLPNYTTDQVTVPNNLVIGGVAAQGLGTVTFPVNQYGSDRNPNQNVLNVRIGRIFPIKEHATLEVTMELFNALNVAPAQSVNYLNGSGTKAFGYQSSPLPPMIGRIGAIFKF